MRHKRLLGIFALGAMLAGCGGAAPDSPAMNELPAEPGFERGVILGARPLGAAPDPRRAIAAQVLGAAAGGAAGPGADAVELLVRLERGGRDVALVQSAEAWLRPGQRVRFTPSGVARDGSGA